MYMIRTVLKIITPTKAVPTNCRSVISKNPTSKVGGPVVEKEVEVAKGHYQPDFPPLRKFKMCHSYAIEK